MIFDAHKNLALSAVIVAPVPATSGTTLTVTLGTGVLFPTAPFNCTIYPAGRSPLITNAEIVRVTSVVGDVLTIVRAQEGTAARSIRVGDSIGNTMTVKVFTDIENAVNSISSSVGTIVGGGGIQSLIAGANSATGPGIVFSNSNGVSFGIAGNTLTASFSSASAGGAAISAGTNSQNTGTIVFSNSNGVSFGLDVAGVLTASAAGASQSIQTQSVVQGISAGTQAGRTGDIVFSNANGITFGMANSSVVTASHNGLTSQSGQAFSASGGSTTFQTLNFVNANGFTFSNSAGSVGASYTVPTQSTQPVAVTTPTGGYNFSTLSFSNANGISFGTSAGSAITASVTVASTQGSFRISAGATNNLLSNLSFSDGSNISFGLNGSTITASVATSLTNIKVSAGTASNNLSAITFSDAGGISFGLNGSVITANGGTAAASPINFSAGTTSSNLVSVVFSNSNGVSFGLSGATITAITSESLLDYYANMDPLFVSAVNSFVQSTSYIQPIYFAGPISFDFIRMIRSGDRLVAQTTGQTTSNTQFSCGYTRSHNFAFYSRGSGVNSQSLQFYASTQLVENYSNNVSAAATNTSQYSYSNRYTFPCSTGLSGFTLDYSSSSAALNFNSVLITVFTALKEMDFPFATTLSAGNWWLMYGQSSTSSSQYTSLGFRNIITFNVVGASINNYSIGVLGSATQPQLSPMRGFGSFTTVGGATTNSLAFSHITNSNSGVVPYFQFMQTK